MENYTDLNTNSESVPFFLKKNGKQQLCKDANKIHSLNFYYISKILWAIMILINVSMAKCYSSIPMTQTQDRSIQTRIIQLVQFNSTQHSMSLVFSHGMSTIPLSENVFVSISSMNYYVNEYIVGSYFGIYFDIVEPVPSSATSIELKLNHLQDKLNMIKLSILIFSNQNQYINQIQSTQYSYRPGDIYEFTTTYQDAMIAPFLTACQISTWNKFSFQHILQRNATQVSTQVIFNGFFLMNSTSANYKYLIIYKQRINILMRPQFINSKIIYSSSGGNLTTIVTVDYYNPSISSYIMGLQSFTYIPNTSGFRGVYFSMDENYNPNKVKLNVDNQFTSLQYNILILNKNTCPTKQHPFKMRNNTSHKIECFDQCPQTRFERYSPQYKSYHCPFCGSNCIKCLSYQICNQCQPQFYLTSNYKCKVKEQYFKNDSGVFLCSSNLTNCITCENIVDNQTVFINGTPTVISVNIPSCTLCSQNYYLSLVDNLTYSCQLCISTFPHCVKCTYLYCVQCQPNYTLIDSATCQLPNNTVPSPIICSTSLCQKCHHLRLDFCQKCKNQSIHVLVNGVCIEKICGDGKIDPNEQCDDGNNLNYDGCNSKCLQIQNGFQCDLQHFNVKATNLTVSDCYYNKPIELSIRSIKKIINHNKLQIKLQNSAPFIRAWQYFNVQDLSEMLSFKVRKFQNYSKGYQFNYTVSFEDKDVQHSNLRILTTGSYDPFNPDDYSHLFLSISYGQEKQSLQSLNHHISEIIFQPYKSNLSIFRAYSTSYQTEFALVTDNNYIIQYYNDEYHQNCKIFYGMGLLISGTVLLHLLISVVVLLIEKKNSQQVLTTLELAFIVQLTYFSLMGIDEINPFFACLAQGLKYSSGYDFILIGTDNINWNRSSQGIGIQSFHITDNVNLSVLLILFCLVLGLTLKIINKYYLNSSTDNEKCIPIKGSQKTQSEQQNQDLYAFEGIGFLGIYSALFLENIGLIWVLFFLYKFIFSTMIQLKYGMSEIENLDVFFLIAVISIVLISSLLMLFKSDIFSTVTQKIIKKKMSLLNNQTREIEEVEENHNKNSSLKDFFQRTSNYLGNPKKTYFLTIIISHLGNLLCLLLFYQSFWWHLAPILFYVIEGLYLIKVKFYNYPNIIRLGINKIAGILIQILLMIRQIFMKQVSGTPGNEQTQLGLYLPVTIMTVLLVVSMISTTFLMYSVKRIRCCQLQMQWQKLNSPFNADSDNKNNCIQEKNIIYRKVKSKDIRIQHMNKEEQQQNQRNTQSVKEQQQIVSNKQCYTTNKQEEDISYYQSHDQKKQENKLTSQTHRQQNITRALKRKVKHSLKSTLITQQHKKKKYSYTDKQKYCLQQQYSKI